MAGNKEEDAEDMDFSLSHTHTHTLDTRSFERSKEDEV